MKLFLFICLLVSLENAMGQNEKNNTYQVKRSVFLSPTKDTLTPNEFIGLLNGGLYDLSVVEGNDSMNIQQLDSGSLIRLFNKEIPVKKFKLRNSTILSLKKENNYILHFWNSTCKPCIAELDSLIFFVKQHPELNFIFITNDNEIQVDKIFKSKIRANYAMVINADNVIKQFAVTSYPTFITIGKGFILKKAFLSTLDADIKEELINSSD